MRTKLQFFFGIIIVLASCNPPANRRVDEEAVKEELKNREVKRVSDGEILATAQELGSEISSAAQSALFSELKQALGEKGIAGAIRYCNLSAYPIVDSLSKTYNAAVKRTSLKTRNPSNKPSEVEIQALEAYRYSYQQDSLMSGNVQETNGEILYTRPIVVQNPLCLGCHGKIGQDIAPSDYEIIKKLYPGDEATGYKVGDFRGIWSIRLSKKAIILSL